MIGQIIGNYKIEEKLGEGGMGAVYKGVDTMLDREVAIKALRPELASQTSVVERFRSEAVTLAKLNHPNIATLYTMFRQGDELYMVLEFVRGETLDNILQRRGVLPAEEAVPVFCQVLDGIDHAHELGIVHRDIKPANMMLTEKGTLKVLDFGIARLLGSARMTRAGNIIGTLEYMAPEQVRGLETDGRSDIYALGMMLYEVLTGRLPFQTENEFELMKLQTEATPQPPREINPAIPPEVEAAIMKAIAKDPAERFQTAGEFRELLLEAGFGAQGTMHGATGTHRRPATHPSRPPAVSTPGIDAAGSSSQESAIKATRLGEPVAAPQSSGGIKETRLGASVSSAPAASAPKSTRLAAAASYPAQTGPSQEAAPSFFSRLTWVHYAGAGAVALVLIGILTAVPIIMLAGASSEPAKVDEQKIVKPEERPQVVEAPKPQQPALDQPPPQQQQLGSGVPAASNPGPSGSQGGELVPVESAPAGQKNSPKVVAEAPAPKQAAPKPAPKKPAAKKPSAECLLTGDC